MTIAADWFVDLGRAADDDPFGPRPEVVGKPIDLLGDQPALSERLVALFRQESDLAEAGTTCPVRDQPDSSCSACPVRRTDPLEAMSALCGVGVEQERTSTRLAILRVPRN